MQLTFSLMLIPKGGLDRCHWVVVWLIITCVAIQRYQVAMSDEKLSMSECSWLVRGSKKE